MSSVSWALGRVFSTFLSAKESQAVLNIPWYSSSWPPLQHMLSLSLNNYLKIFVHLPQVFMEAEATLCPITADCPPSVSVAAGTVRVHSLFGVTKHGGRDKISHDGHRKESRTSVEVCENMLPLLIAGFERKVEQSSWAKGFQPLHSCHEIFQGGLFECHLPSSLARDWLWKWICTYSECHPYPNFVLRRAFKMSVSTCFFHYHLPSLRWMCDIVSCKVNFPTLSVAPDFKKTAHTKKPIRKVSICSIELFASQEIIISPGNRGRIRWSFVIERLINAGSFGIWWLWG